MITTRRKYWLHISSTDQAKPQVNTEVSPQTARNFGLGDSKPRSTGVGDGRLHDRVDRVVHGRRTRSAGPRSRRRCNKVESGGNTSSRWSDSGHWVHRPRAAWSIPLATIGDCLGSELDQLDLGVVQSVRWGTARGGANQTAAQRYELLGRNNEFDRLHPVGQIHQHPPVQVQRARLVSCFPEPPEKDIEPVSY